MWDVFDVVVGLHEMGFSRNYLPWPSWDRDILEVTINRGAVSVIAHTPQGPEYVWTGRAPVCVDDFMSALAYAAIKWGK